MNGAYDNLKGLIRRYELFVKQNKLLSNSVVVVDFFSDHPSYTKMIRANFHTMSSENDNLLDNNNKSLLFCVTSMIIGQDNTFKIYKDTNHMKDLKSFIKEVRYHIFYDRLKSDDGYFEEKRKQRRFLDDIAILERIQKLTQQAE